LINRKFQLLEGDILLIKLTGHDASQETLVVSEHALNQAERAAIKSAVQNNFHKNLMYFSVEEHPEGFVYGGKIVTFGSEDGKRTVTCTSNVSALEAVFEISYDTGTVPNDAELTNEYTPKTVTLELLKLDINYMDEATSLPEAGFTLRKLDPDGTGAYLSGEKALTKTSEAITSVFENVQTIYRISGIPDGFYEIEETNVPKGYILIDVGKFYIKVVDGQITRIDKCTSDDPETTGLNEATVKNCPNHTTDDNIVFVSTKPASQDNPATTDVNEASDAVFLFKVGNTPGAALPNTGGSGTNMIYLLGMILTGIAGTGLMMQKHKRTV